MAETPEAVVGIIMGSHSDLDIMSEAAKVLEEFKVPYDLNIVSAHRTPDVMFSEVGQAQEKGKKIIIAGAGGSAHLPGMAAALTELPVLAVPIKRPTHDHEALWSSIKMPPGAPLAVMPENGAKNAALFAIEILSLSDMSLAALYKAYRIKQHDDVVAIDEEINRVGWRKFLENDQK